MHFASRLQAGRMLADKLVTKYRYENCAVVALNDGGAMVGAQIAMQLHCVLMLLSAGDVQLPAEFDAITGIAGEDNFSFSQRHSDGQYNELIAENRNWIEETKIRLMHDMNVLLGSGGTINRQLLRGHNVILVSDGMANGLALELAYEYLKPIKIDKLIVATPLASIPAVDQIHALADEIYCLDVHGSYTETKDYYQQSDVPDHEVVIKTIENIVLNWT